MPANTTVTENTANTAELAKMVERQTAINAWLTHVFGNSPEAQVRKLVNSNPMTGLWFARSVEFLNRISEKLTAPEKLEAFKQLPVPSSWLMDSWVKSTLGGKKNAFTAKEALTAGDIIAYVTGLKTAYEGVVKSSEFLGDFEKSLLSDNDDDQTDAPEFDLLALVSTPVESAESVAESVKEVTK